MQGFYCLLVIAKGRLKEKEANFYQTPMIIQGTFLSICFFFFFLASEVGGIVSVVIGEKLQMQINGATFSRVLQALSDKKEV